MNVQLQEDFSMNRLKEKIAVFNIAKAEQVPADILDITGKAAADLKSLGLEKRSLQAGDTVSDFTLTVRFQQ